MTRARRPGGERDGGEKHPGEKHRREKHGTGIRLTAGALRGRNIRVPPGATVRPMRTRVRQALFNILGDAIRDARVLDVFAGSGALAFESLSRGAASALLVENDPQVVALLRQSIAELALAARARVAPIDAYRDTPPAGATFDVIFLDPPFADYEGHGGTAHNPWTLATRLATTAALAPSGFMALEYPAHLAPPPPPAGCALAVARAYGDTAIAVWRKETPASA